MKCPYCGREMACGYLYNSSQPLQWIPRGKRPSMFSYSLAEEGIPLNNEFSFFKIGGYHAEAFFCESCRVMIAKAEAKAD